MGRVWLQRLEMMMTMMMNGNGWSYIWSVLVQLMNKIGGVCRRIESNLSNHEYMNDFTKNWMMQSPCTNSSKFDYHNLWLDILRRKHFTVPFDFFR